MQTCMVTAILIKEITVSVAQEDSGAIDGGTKRFCTLPMSLMKDWAWAPKEQKTETTKVTTRMRTPGGGRRVSSKYSRGAACSRAWRLFRACPHVPWPLGGVEYEPAAGSTILTCTRQKKPGPSRPTTTKSGDLRRKAPSRWRNEVI